MTEQTDKNQNIQQNMSGTPSGNLFDQLLADPNGAQRVHQMLQNSRAQRNTMSIEEFSTYQEIFQLDGRQIIGDARFDRLAQRWFERVCPYDPVTITHAGEIVTVLPPVFNRTAPITDLGTVGSDISQAFLNANALPDEISAAKRKFYMDKYIELLDIAQNTKLQESIKSLSDKMVDDSLKVLGRGAVRTDKKKQDEIRDRRR